MGLNTGWREGRTLYLLPGTSLYTPAWDPKFICCRLLPKTRRSEDQHERTQELAELSALTQEVKRSKQPLKGPVGLGLRESVLGVGFRGLGFRIAGRGVLLETLFCAEIAIQRDHQGTGGPLKKHVEKS